MDLGLAMATIFSVHLEVLATLPKRCCLVELSVLSGFFKLQTQLALLRPHADVGQNRVPYPNGFNRRFSLKQAI
jgi:hypothetical protein